MIGDQILFLEEDLLDLTDKLFGCRLRQHIEIGGIGSRIGLQSYLNHPFFGIGVACSAVDMNVPKDGSGDFVVYSHDVYMLAEDMGNVNGKTFGQ